MEVILFMGLQAVGKSTFYRTQFDRTHLRINLDMLKTRHRERRLFETCLAIGQRCVIDNTNPTPVDRARYIEPAQQANFRVSGYYFQSELSEALVRNAARPDAERIPEAGLKHAFSRLQRPTWKEGFDELYYVRFDSRGGFVIEAWRDDL